MSESHGHLTKAHVKQQTTRKNQCFLFFNNFFTDKKKNSLYQYKLNFLNTQYFINITKYISCCNSLN